MSDLTDAMGINRPSLYAAFGNKDALFRKVLARYASGPASYVKAALAEPTARRVVEKLLMGATCDPSSSRAPRGCLAVQGALACGKESAGVQRDLSAFREAGVAAIRARLVRAKREGDLPGHSNPGDLARYVATVLHGMAVEAAGGSKPAELRRVAKLALAVWPN